MSAERFARLKALFIDALDLELDARSTFVDELADRDAELAAELQRLLDSHDRAAIGETAAIPERIGEYAIAEVIGVGGMGIVYRAEQRRPRRSVAIKLLRSELATPALLRRFEVEAELLGRLRHPGVVQIFEAGTWEHDGIATPFVVMEHVEGEPLVAHADRRQLDTAARLRLLQEVCDVVEAAHRVGVIHRDLKPDNILVDADGRVRVLDFGVARAIEADGERTALTLPGTLVGTLAYMSPEHVGAGDGAVDTRSDVYALGLIGFELLTGRLPRDLRGAPLPVAAEIIRDGACRSLGAVDPSLRGDLETILAKTLANDPERRYGSAAALADDLGRFLEERPIMARPPSTSYQVRLFARRNPRLVASLAGAAVVLLLATVVAIGLMLEARRQQSLAEQEADKLRAVNDFFVTMIQSVNPARNLAGVERPLDVRVVDVLDWAAENMSDAYEDQPEVEAALRRMIAEAYATLSPKPDDDAGPREKALAQFERVLAIQRTLRDDEDPETIRAAIQVADAMVSVGRITEGERGLRAALATCERALGPDHELTIEAINTLVSMLFSHDRNDETVAMAREALMRADRALSGEHEARLAALNNLAFLIDASEAVPLLRDLLAIRRRTLGDEHVSTLRARENLVWAIRQVGGREGELVVELETIVDLKRAIYGPEHTATLWSMNNLGAVLTSAGRYDKAIEVLEATIAGYERIGDPAVLGRFNLAGALLRAGRLERAEQVARGLLELQLAEETSNPGRVAFSTRQVGRVLVAAGRDAEAEPLLAETAELMREAHGADSSRAIDAACEHADVLLRLRRFEEAEERLLGCPAPATPTVVRACARLYEAWDRPDDAAAWQATLGE